MHPAVHRQNSTLLLKARTKHFGSILIHPFLLALLPSCRPGATFPACLCSPMLLLTPCCQLLVPDYCLLVVPLVATATCLPLLLASLTATAAPCLLPAVDHRLLSLAEAHAAKPSFRESERVRGAKCSRFPPHSPSHPYCCCCLLLAINYCLPSIAYCSSVLLLLLSA